MIALPLPFTARRRVGRSVREPLRETNRSILACVAIIFGVFDASAAPGDVDSDFNVGGGALTATRVRAVALQPDGRFLLGGDFTNLDGNPRLRIARLNGDGSLDLSFAPSANDIVYRILVQADGKIIVAGSFTQVNGQDASCVARLESDGSLDTSFVPPMFSDSSFQAAILSLALQADGAILVGGVFDLIGAAPRNRVARLNADGSLDEAFNPGTDGLGPSEIVLQGDGKILLAGSFSTVAGQPRNRIARIAGDGGIDPGFDPGAGPDDAVAALALQPDGRILIGGQFTSYGGEPASYVARLLSDGSFDGSFSANPNFFVKALAVEGGGGVLIGGDFTEVSDRAWPGLARVDPQGNLDTSFSSSTQAGVRAIVLQNDGKILIGGTFAVPSNGIARLLGKVAPLPPSPPLLTLSRPRAFPRTAVGKRSKPQTIRVTNSGGTAATGITARLSGKAAKDFRLTHPAATLAPGAATSFRATFRPRAKGARKATVTVHSSNAAATSVPLKGRGR